MIKVEWRMPAITFSRKHYRFACRLVIFISLGLFLLALILRKGGTSVNIDAPAAWLKESFAALPKYNNLEDTRDFWQVIIIVISYIGSLPVLELGSY